MIACDWCAFRTAEGAKLPKAYFSEAAEKSWLTLDADGPLISPSAAEAEIEYPRLECRALSALGF